MTSLKKNLITNYLLLVTLLFFGLFCSKGLFKEYGFATHDGDHHISRSFDAIQTLKEGHFPMRWAGSLNGWCGVPIFNFFYPLIYYLVFLVNFAVGDVINSLKIVASLSFIVGPMFFYLWLKCETKNKIASFTGAFLYLFVPYRFLLVFVRFSPEFMAYTLLPILLWFISILLEKLKKKIELKTIVIAFVTSLIGGLFVISHNFGVMLILPIIGLWTILKVIKEKIFSKEKLFLLIFVFISFIGIGIFFIGPMLLEKQYVKLDTMRTMDYRDHFPTLSQLIRSPWDYGNSLSGTDRDGMSFMLGYAQWLVLGFVLFFLANYFLDKKKNKKLPVEIIYWFALSSLSIFFILPWSKFIWDRIPILQEIQFSWRFLGVTSFTIAALAGFLLSKIKNKKIFYGLTLVFVSIAFYGNRNHLRIQQTPYPQKYINYEMNHDHRYATTSIFDDILNKKSKQMCLASANMSPGMSIIFTPQVKDITLKTQRGNTFGKVSVDSPLEIEVSMRLSLEYFPGIYKIKFNGQEISEINNCEGRVCLDGVKLIKGENVLEWKVGQSPTEKFFNWISGGFLAVWVLIIIFAILLS